MQYVVEPTPEHLARFQKSLEPMRLLLSDQPFFGGSEPKYADLAVAGAFAVCFAAISFSSFLS